MKNYSKMIRSNALYIWVDECGIPNIPGMTKGSCIERTKRLPKEVYEIKKEYWDYLYPNEFSSMIVTYEGINGILLKWDFWKHYMMRYCKDLEKAEKAVCSVALELDKSKYYGEILIELECLIDGGHSIYWFVPDSELPIGRLYYPDPKGLFEFTFDDAETSEEERKRCFKEVEDYEIETGFHFKNDIIRK